MFRNKELLELLDNMDVAHALEKKKKKNALENLLETISCPAHVERKVVEACQIHFTVNFSLETFPKFGGNHFSINSFLFFFSLYKMNEIP